MSDWGVHSNFRIPDTISSRTPRSGRHQPPEGDNNSITGHERFVLAINNIVQVPDGWQCHVCDTHIPGSDYEAWVHTYDDDHRRRRPPKPKRPADLPPCLDVRDYSGAMHCDVCRVRLTNYAAQESHLRGRQHTYRLDEQRRRARNNNDPH
ncbi:hypothetical protein FOZ61_004784 [Perkinsus olseni]|uniref:U1-type domain-containing protein n=1 Tax=Perkinsus olseni TaxID=32597 RepID=A0A7J6MCB9_PEROL|nr:hypothetical protein FOZ61_004784 [Perkinsus olseni]